MSRMTIAIAAFVMAVSARDAAGDDGAWLVSAKLGGIVPLDGLWPYAAGGVELGRVFSGDGRVAIVLDLDYTQPTTTGTASDSRVMGGSYTWRLEEQELGIMPAVIYRLSQMAPVIPYGGLGPRVLVARSTVRGSSPMFSSTRERSTRIGAGLPLGVELPLGPGHAIAELLLQYGTIDHVATGESTTGALALTIGYRGFL